MGTPDIKGYYGLFNYYTNEYRELTQEAGGGGRVHEVYVIGNRVEAQLPGPDNSFRRESPETLVDFKVFLDPENPVAKIVIQGQEFILKEKEWSGWKKVELRAHPDPERQRHLHVLPQGGPAEVQALRQPHQHRPGRTRPCPSRPPNPTPRSWRRSSGPSSPRASRPTRAPWTTTILDEGEFLEQDDMVLRESLAMYEDELRTVRIRAASSIYFSNTDQRQHMFWRLIDPQHPAYDAGLASKYGNVIENIYVEMDRVLARTMERIGPDTTIIVMSDHGFNPFRRGFNLNTWLKESGYHTLVDDRQAGGNVALREHGLVAEPGLRHRPQRALHQPAGPGEDRESSPPAPEADNLVREIARKLEEVIDPVTGERVILKAYVAKDVYQGPYVDQAPDIVLGFNRGIPHLLAIPPGELPQGHLREQHPEMERRPHVRGRGHPRDPAGEPGDHGGVPGPLRRDGHDPRRLRDRAPTPGMIGTERPEGLGRKDAR